METVRLKEKKHHFVQWCLFWVRSILAIAILAFNARMTLVLRGTDIKVASHGNFDNETNTVSRQAIYNKGVVKSLCIPKLIDIYMSSTH